MHHLVTRSRSLSTAALLGLFAAGLSAQTSVSIPCAADNTVYFDVLGGTSNGSGSTFIVGRNGVGTATRGLLRFDVAAVVPAGASIVSAQLTIEAQQSQYASTLNLGVHRVLQAWGEGGSVAPSGGGFGTAAQAGDATWLHSMFPTTFWTNPGGDFAPASFVLPTPPNGIASSVPGPETVGDVQFWLDNPAQNFGWLLLSNESLTAPTARRFTSSEASAGTRPTLTVNYLLASQSGVWGTGCPTANGTFGFNWTGSIVGGTTIQLNVTNGPPNTGGAFYFDLSLYAQGGLLHPSCNVYLNPVTAFQGFLFPTDALGNGSASWTLPTIYPGLFFATQAIAFDPSPFGGPFQIVLSNAGTAKIQ